MAWHVARQLIWTAPPLMRFSRFAWETRSFPLMRILPSSRMVMEPSPTRSVSFLVASITSSAGGPSFVASGGALLGPMRPRTHRTHPTGWDAMRGRHHRSRARPLCPPSVAPCSGRRHSCLRRRRPRCHPRPRPLPCTGGVAPRRLPECRAYVPFPSLPPRVVRPATLAHDVLLVVEELVTEAADVVPFELDVERINH